MPYHNFGIMVLFKVQLFLNFSKMALTIWIKIGMRRLWGGQTSASCFLKLTFKRIKRGSSSKINPAYLLIIFKTISLIILFF